MNRFRLLPVFVVLATLLTLWPSEAQARQSDVRVVYSVQEVRSGRFISHVSLTNMTSQPLSAWSMSFRMDDPIDGMDNVTWSRFGNIYDVQGAGVTHRIEPGGVVWFTLHGVTSGPTAERPRSCSFNGLSCTVESADQPVVEQVAIQDLIVSAWIAEQDQTTFTGHIVVRNPTDIDLNHWTMSFSSTSLITGIEGVDWTRSGSTYSVEGKAATSRVLAGGFVFFTFNGVHNGSPQIPLGCQINGVACAFSQPDRLIETPRMKLFMKVDKISETVFEGYVVLENPTDEDLESWTLRFNLEDRITMVGRETSWSRSGDLYTIHGENGLKRILRGTSVYFPIAGTYEDDIEPPSDCTVNGVLCLIDSEGTTVQPTSTNDGGTGGGDTGGGDTGGGDTGGGDTGGGDTGGGTVTCADTDAATTGIAEIDFLFLHVSATNYTAQISITNTGGGLIRGWDLAFRLVDGMSITRHWASVFTQNADGSFVASNDSSNDCIAEGEVENFGFEGTYADVLAEPVGCAFGTQSCVFLRAMQTDREQEATVPASAVVASAFPNPFQTTARVVLQTDVTQHVRVDAWDMLGRRVQHLFEGTLVAGSDEMVTLDGAYLPSGMYIIRMEGEDGRSHTRSVLLQK